MQCCKCIQIKGACDCSALAHQWCADLCSWQLLAPPRPQQCIRAHELLICWVAVERIALHDVDQGQQLSQCTHLCMQWQS